MAGYPAPREQMYTNVTGLNALPAEYDMALHRQQQHPAGYDFQSDLDMFTNTQFFDLDMGEVPETNSPGSHDGEHWPVHPAYLGGDRANFNANYPAGAAAPYPGYSGQSSSSSTPAMDQRLKTIDGELKASPGGPIGMEEASRMAAEEDKRRRNTAASARFRVKKKQREQALEKTAKDMTDRVTYLENRVTTLELENKLLKDLITEKSGATSAPLDLDGLRKRADGQRKSDDEERRRRDVKIESAALAAAQEASR